MTDHILDEDNKNKVTTVFWIIGTAALLWSLVGVCAFIGDVTKSEGRLALLSEAERAFYGDNPWWHSIVYGLATMGGFTGSLALLRQKRSAANWFLISSIAAIILFLYGLLGSNVKEVYGIAFMLFPIFIAIIAALLWYFAKKCDAKGWLS